MVRWRTHRRWLWRTNALLVVVLALLGAIALRPPAPIVVPIFEPMPPAVDAAAKTGPWIAWAELRTSMRGFHTLPAEPRFKAPPTPTTQSEVAEPGPLPLAAFEVRVWIRLPDEPDVILLASKDPAHPETHVLREGQHAGTLEFVAQEVNGEQGRFRVRRGDETFCFTYSRATDWSAPGLRRVSFHEGGTRLATRGAAHGDAPATSNALAHDVKAVPFFGDEGKVIGARVTGVRPGTWAERQGLLRGDVITALGEAPFVHADEVVTKLRTIAQPNRICVLRRSGDAIERMTLGDS